MSAAVMIFGAIGLVTIVVTAYFLMRFLKGSIDLHLSTTSFDAGETVNGKLTLHAKQAIEVNKLLVILTADEVTKRRNSDGDEESETDEIYRDEVLVDCPKQLNKGFQEDFEFELKIPDSSESSMESSALGQALNTVGVLLNTNTRRLEWNIEARLDAKGVDLSDSERIYIK